MNFELDDADLEIEALLDEAVAEIVRHEDRDHFLSWMRHRFQPPLFMEQPEQEWRSIATMLGHAIWNATPLPGNRFLPAPVPLPGRNDPCLCGSGRKFKACCAQLPALPPIGQEAVWPLVLTHLPKRVHQEALAAGKLPTSAVISLAVLQAEEGTPKKAAATLEALFAAGIRKPDREADYAMNMLCDLYDDLGFTNKKLRLLQHLIDTEKRSPLRASAWERLSLIRMDADQLGLAREAFRNAQQDDPDSPSLGILEVQLLLAERNTEQAKQRAKFWLKRIEKQDWVNDEALELLRSVALDPSGTLTDLSIEAAGGAGERFKIWLDRVKHRPPARYELSEPIEDFPDGGDADTGRDPVQHGRFLIAPPALENIRDGWLEVFPIEKPFSVQERPFQEGDVWDIDEEDAWVSWLEHHPQAFDSLDILDDLATALYQHEQFETPWFRETMFVPVLLRARAIIEHTLGDGPQPQLSWLFAENRPALRSLVRLAFLRWDQGELDEARPLFEWLLQLNPKDNHGLRAILINEYLKAAENLPALELAGAYPDDMMVEIQYGKALALYRLGRTAEADDALADAKESFPKVIRYLTRQRIRRPEFGPHGISLGGDDEAWLYRQAMREVWTAAPGAIEWLKKAAPAP